MPCARPPRRCPRARARNAQPNPNGDADVALLQSRFFAPPATRPESESPAARATSSGSCTHAPAEPLEDAARAELYKIASGEEDGALRAEHERLMDAEPGYCAFFVEWLDRRRRLLDAKPVLIQEHLASDVWRMLVAVTLLNKTAGKHALPVFWHLMDQWPSAEALARADIAEVVDAIKSLGLQATRGARLVAMSRAYLLRAHPPAAAPEPARATCRSKYYLVDAPERLSEFAPELHAPASPGKQQQQQQQQRARRPVTPISGLPGSGQYATDSYRIFCAGEDEWRRVVPKDKELVRFLKWRWAVEGLRWSPDGDGGVIGPATQESLEALIQELVLGDPALR